VAGLGSKPFSTNGFAFAPTDLRCLQSNPSIGTKCPAEVSGLSNHNTESVRASIGPRSSAAASIDMMSESDFSGIKRYRRKQRTFEAKKAAAVDLFLQKPVRPADLQKSRSALAKARQGDDRPKSGCDAKFGPLSTHIGHRVAIKLDLSVRA
jgi:hypothetical protein